MSTASRTLSQSTSGPPSPISPGRDARSPGAIPGFRTRYGGRGIGPNCLRYLDCFLGLLAGSGLDTSTKMTVIALINGFAIMYGGMEATLASQQASTGVSPDQHLAAQVTAMVSAAATGQYPNLAAALTASELSRVRDADEVFDSCVYRLIDGALAG